MRVLVTGATGLLGANVVRALLAAGHAVRVTVRAGSDTRGIEGVEVERVVAPLRDRAALDEAMAGCLGLVHCAATVWVGRTGDDDLFEVNVEGTRRVLGAAGEAGVERVVHVSTVDALSLRSDGLPAREEDVVDAPMFPCGYVLSKRAAEAVALEHADNGLHTAIVNPGFMLGPWDTKPTSGQMVLEVARGRARLAPGGGNCFLDVRDAATTVVAALERGVSGRRYILGGENLTYLEAWTRMARVVGASPPWGVAPRPLAWIVGQAAGAWGRLVGREPAINPVTVAMGELPHYFASDRARAELGLPEPDFDRAVAASWEWFREQGMAA